MRIQFRLAIVVAMLPVPALAQVCAAPSHLERQASFGAEQGIEFDVRDVEVDSSGRVFVTQVMTPQVVILDRDGQLDGTLGRAGQGPGEFEQAPWSLGLFGDTLWVAEHPVTGLVHFFGPDGEFIRRVRELTSVGDGILRVSTAEPFSDGSFLGGVRWNYSGLQPHHSGHPILVLEKDGSIRDTLVVYPHHETPVVMERSRGSHPLHQFLAPRLMEDGSGVLWVEDRSRDLRFAVMKGMPNGDVLELFAVSYEPVRIDRAERRRILDAYGARVDERRRGERMEALEPLIPAVYPPVRAMLPGHSGAIWLLREPREDGVDRWEVYAEDGSLLNVVGVDFGAFSTRYPSPRIDIHHVDGNEVWASTRGEFDEVTLHRFEVVPGC